MRFIVSFLMRVANQSPCCCLVVFCLSRLDFLLINACIAYLTMCSSSAVTHLQYFSFYGVCFAFNTRVNFQFDILSKYSNLQFTAVFRRGLQKL